MLRGLYDPGAINRHPRERSSRRMPGSNAGLILTGVVVLAHGLKILETGVRRFPQNYGIQELTAAQNIGSISNQKMVSDPLEKKSEKTREN